MGIKRYYASKDNTITNAYKANLTTRGVSGNMGQSDILETFHIYGQAASSSAEKSRILVQFDIDDITADRANGTIPASGSVSFFLNLYNAEHSQTTPKNFNLIASSVSGLSWQEGDGLDMEEYSDKDESNWIKASDDPDIAASASITVEDVHASGYTLNFAGTPGGALYSFVSAAEAEPGVFVIGANAAATAINIAAIVNTSASADFNANAVGSIIHLTSSAVGTGGNSNSLSASKTGDGSRSTSVTITGSNSVANNGRSASFGGGSGGTWLTEGGDYHTDTSSSFTQSFDTGFENLELNITPLVEQWANSTGNVLGSKPNYGIGVRLSSTEEDAATSYYTKKFFARGSQFFFKRPTIEARFDNSKKDNRGNFYLSSSLVPAADNLMKLYLYNVVKGQLTNIPLVGTGDLHVSLYSGSTVPVGPKLGLSVGGGTVAVGDYNTTASYVETGIYSCSFAYTSSAITKIFDVWHSGTYETEQVQYHTGSAITVNTYDSQNYNFDQKYVSNVTNLRAIYSTEEEVRFRLYVRQKDWSPTIYTIASKAIETSTIEDVYYKIVRAADNLKVIPFGTGSLNYTRLSYDTNGSYFDLKMELLDTNAVYEMSFAYLINGNYVEQPERFKFRVE